MIIRRKRHRHYTIIGNDIADDDRLSFESLGLLTYLLSRPDNWSVHVKQLCKRGGCGRDKTRRVLNELIAAGYVVRQKIRSVDGGQFVRGDYEVHDVAQPVDDDSPELELPPGPENPSVARDVFSGAGKHVPIINNNLKQSFPPLPPHPTTRAESAGRPNGSGMGTKPRSKPPDINRGETEILIASRLGPNGWDILMDLPGDEVGHLCQMQRRGQLYQSKLEELRDRGAV